MTTAAQRTFAQARDEILKHLAREGWRTKPALKVPQATDPETDDVLFFKTQAVYLNQHSLWVDIRKMTPEQFVKEVRKVQDIRKKHARFPR